MCIRDSPITLAREHHIERATDVLLVVDDENARRDRVLSPRQRLGEVGVASQPRFEVVIHTFRQRQRGGQAVGNVVDAAEGVSNAVNQADH